MHKYIDLRGTPCPINFVRCRLEIERLNYNISLNTKDRDEALDAFLNKRKPKWHNE